MPDDAPPPSKSAKEQSEGEGEIEPVRGGKRSGIWDYFDDEPKKPLTQKDKDKMTPEEMKGWRETNWCLCKVIVNSETKRTCGARIKRFQGNTKGMTGHLLSMHKAEYADYLKKRASVVVADATDTHEVIESAKQFSSAQDEARRILEKPPLARKGPNSQSIQQYFPKQVTLEKWKLNSQRQRRVDLEIMQFLARCSLPFSTVDQPAFAQ